MPVMEVISIELGTTLPRLVLLPKNASHTLQIKEKLRLAHHHALELENGENTKSRTTKLSAVS